MTPSKTLSPELRQRFDRNAPVGLPDECWEWTGYRDPKGYGRFTFKGGRYKAHSFALSLIEAQPSPAHCCCHRCDNPSCVNPAHLWWGTNAENQRDKVAKGRFKSPFPSILNWEIAAEVRQLSKQGLSTVEIGKRYGVHPTTIGLINNNKTWKESNV